MRADELVAYLEDRGSSVQRQREGDWMVQCPAHEDRTPSLHVTERDDRVLLKCQAGCQTDAVLAAAELDWGAVFHDSPNGQREIVAEYPYHDAQGRLLFQVVRYWPKDFRQRRPDGAGGWIWKLDGVPRVLYRLPRILGEAIEQGEPVFVCEGERDVDALERLGLYATCNPMGAGKWRDEYSQALANAADVCVVRDRDEEGYKHAEAVIASLRKVGLEPTLLEPRAGKDVTEHLAAGHSWMALVPVSAESEAPNPTNKAEQSLSSAYFVGSRVKPRRLGRAAYHGLAGRIVRLLEPHSEAAPESLLAQLLIAVGSALGPGAPACMAEDDRHLGRLFGVLVGPTSNARKGTSWGRVRRVMRGADPKWAAECLRHGGLSSGEGLIQAFGGSASYGIEDLIQALGSDDEKQLERLRAEDDVLREMADAISAWDGQDGAQGLFKTIAEAQAKAERATGEETEQRSRSQELRDGRLLLLEAEFSRVLRVCNREHSITAAIVRSLWDGDEANVLTRQKPLVVKGAHLSIIAHITQMELRRELTEMELMNGFANRFLFFYVERSKSLPHGGQVPEQELNPLVDKLAAVVSREWGQETTGFDSAAAELWTQRYDDLIAERPGLHGAATARAAPQVLRLALIYALLDQARLIRIEHLQAALEVWRYCDESAAYLFGGRLGDRVAEHVLAELEESDSGYLDRIEIYEALNRRVSKAEINVALEHLEGLGLIRRESVPTGGRPIQRIHLVPRETAAEGEQ